MHVDRWIFFCEYIGSFHQGLHHEFDIEGDGIGKLGPTGYSCIAISSIYLYAAAYSCI